MVCTSSSSCHIFCVCCSGTQRKWMWTLCASRCVPLVAAPSRWSRPQSAVSARCWTLSRPRSTTWCRRPSLSSRFVAIFPPPPPRPFHFCHQDSLFFNCSLIFYFCPLVCMCIGYVWPPCFASEVCILFFNHILNIYCFHLCIHLSVYTLDFSNHPYFCS